MRKSFVVSLAFAGSVLTSLSSGFANRVIDYTPGLDPAPGFTNAIAALGEPTRVNPFEDDVTPFNPPYSAADVVSVSEGGSLTLQFQTPILAHPGNEFGIDFIIYGNAGFIITNDFNWETFEWIGTPATDGSLFGANYGETRVSVSRDGKSFFTLDPLLAPTVDQMLPTDSYGDFHTAAMPGLLQKDFAGLTENEIGQLYLGSAGGAGYDLAWARDGQGQQVRLQQVRFVRIEVISGRAEVDAVSAVFTPRGLAGK